MWEGISQNQCLKEDVSVCELPNLHNLVHKTVLLSTFVNIVTHHKTQNEAII